MNIAQQDWIGKMPSDWGVVSLRNVLLERKELNKNRFETNILSVTNDRGVINYKDKGNVGNKASDDIERYKKVYKGDIVANSMNVIIGSVGIAPENGVLSPVYIVMKPADSVDVRYYDYIFKAKGFQSQLRRIGYGILDHRMRIPWDNLKMQQLPNPDLSVQQKIADFLDAETAKINNLITKQERLLQLLEEKRRATITHAVTRGLDPNAELKETNIPWLGLIPREWKVTKVGYEAEFASGGYPLPKNSEEEKTEPWILIGDIKNDIATSNQGISKKDIKDLRLRRTKKGELLFSFKMSIGKVAIAGQDMYTTSEIATFYNLRGLDTKYAFYMFPVFIPRNAKKNMMGSDLMNLQLIRQATIALPHIHNQQRIVSYLDGESTKLSVLRQKIHTQITLLRERRTSLISHAVTGKVKI